MGTTCRYLSRSKPTPSKLDLSRYLVTINDRLKQAEAQLAFHSSIQNPTQTPLESDAAASGPVTSNASPPHMDSALLSTLELPDLGGQTMNDWPSMANNDPYEFDFGAPSSSMPIEPLMAPFMPVSNGFVGLDSMLLEMLPAATNHNVLELSPGLLQGLYFDLFHPIMPLICRSRFEAEISEMSPSIEVQSLSFAMAVLGSFSVPELRCHVDRCYEQCRTLLDLCERQDTGESLASINTLQALALLTLYEFKQPNFARAWMTLGRAIRLAKLIGLDRVDSPPNSTVTAPWDQRPRLPPASCAAIAEERRRTFWVLYVFDHPSARPIGLGNADQLTNCTIAMPSIQQIETEISAEVSVSSFSGTLIMVSLYRRCIDHTISQMNRPHAFWETHYSIDKAINHYRGNLLSHHVNNDFSDDPRSLSLRMNLAAVEITLHETALVKVQKDKLPAVLATEAISKCITAATDIAITVQLGQRLTGKKLEIFKHHDRFLVWPMTMAIQTCSRMLDMRGNVDVDPCIENLRVLAAAMKELVSPKHVRPGLLEKIDAWMAAVEGGANAE
ncbi:transcriptional regulator family: Fungal Specific TF [Aspergillus niger]|nr:transcriptional regulator family: Fungal Specific TF [Aspergillus niger]